MRNRNIICSLFAVAILLMSCDEKEWMSRETELVPIYTLSNFVNDNPLQQDVYQTKPIMIEFSTSVQLLIFDMTSFVDNSTDSIYDFSYTLTMDETIDTGVDTIVQTLFERDCMVNAERDSMGTLSYVEHYRYDTVSTADLETVIGSVVLTDTLLTPIAVLVTEDEKYYEVE